MESLFHRRMDNLVNGRHIKGMLLLAQLSVLEFEGLLELGYRVIQLELRLIVKGVKGGLGIHESAELI